MARLARAMAPLRPRLRGIPSESASASSVAASAEAASQQDARPPLARAARARTDVDTLGPASTGAREHAFGGGPAARSRAQRGEHRRRGGRPNVIVTGPSGSSLDDAAYLVGELRERSLHASAVLLNRAVGAPPAWVDELGARSDSEPELGAALSAYRDEYTARATQTHAATLALGGMVPKRTPLVPLPTLKTSDPRVILETLARELAGSALVVTWRWAHPTRSSRSATESV